MTDWGVHEIDIALYAMGAKAPKLILASEGKFAYPDDAYETPVPCKSYMNLKISTSCGSISPV